jgi:lipoprotein-anchoring transpeptidase ErfK/SrfK
MRLPGRQPRIRDATRPRFSWGVQRAVLLLGLVGGITWFPCSPKILTGATPGDPPAVDRGLLPPIITTPPNAQVQTTDEGAFRERPVESVFEAQLYLALRGISPGPMDGLMGSQTRAAIRAFQQQTGLPVTGEFDATTKASMWLVEPPLTNHVVAAEDVARLRPVPTNWLGKSQASALDYETLLELAAERGWAYQRFTRSLNPTVDWTAVATGTLLQIPNVRPPRFTEKAAQVRIFLAQRMLQAFDQAGQLMVHFPCSIAQRVDKRPIGELRVAVLVPDPDYTFDPEIFTESEEGRQLGRRLRIPPGPNNPVGLAWIGLSLPGYGIHGTPDPEKVGRTESHGCFRLANWNARLLLELAWEGMPVLVEP